MKIFIFIFCIPQVHGRIGMPNFQCAIDNRRIFRVCERNVILDGEYLYTINVLILRRSKSIL